MARTQKERMLEDNDLENRKEGNTPSIDTALLGIPNSGFSGRPVGRRQYCTVRTTVL